MHGVPAPFQISGSLLISQVLNLEFWLLGHHWAELIPGCCSCLSCDSLSGSPRAPGLRELDGNGMDSLPSGGGGAAQRLPARHLTGPASAATVTPTPAHPGVCLGMEPPPVPSVLEGPPAVHSQKVSKETESSRPHH